MTQLRFPSRDEFGQPVAQGEQPISVTIPIRLHSLANLGGNWRVRATRVSKLRDIVAKIMQPRRATFPALPAIVMLVRFSPAYLDDDNLRAAFKPARDEIARMYGCDDSRRAPIKWEYDQKKSKTYSVTIEIRPDR